MSGPEAAVFRVVNGTTVLPFVVVWPVMQLGNVLVIPAAALVAAAFRRWWLAGELLLAGGLTYLLAKDVKRVVARGRPHALLSDVVIRGAEAHGRASSPATPPCWRPWPRSPGPGSGAAAGSSRACWSSSSCLARLYVGAHLPLDVVGGVGLGLAVGGAVRLLLGRHGLMLVDSRRGLAGQRCTSGRCRRPVTVLYVLPATRSTVQGVDDAVWRLAGAVRNRPTTSVSIALSWLGRHLVNWPLRVAALTLLAWRRHWLRLAAFGLAVLTSEVLIGTLKAAVDRPRPPGSLIATRRPPSRPGTPSPVRSRPSVSCSCWHLRAAPGGAGRSTPSCSRRSWRCHGSTCGRTGSPTPWPAPCSGPAWPWDGPPR